MTTSEQEGRRKVRYERKIVDNLKVHCKLFQKKIMRNNLEIKNQTIRLEGSKRKYNNIDEVTQETSKDFSSKAQSSVSDIISLG